jgi:hypothetical protein
MSRILFPSFSGWKCKEVIDGLLELSKDVLMSLIDFIVDPDEEDGAVPDAGVPAPEPGHDPEGKRWSESMARLRSAFSSWLHAFWW